MNNRKITDLEKDFDDTFLSSFKECLKIKYNENIEIEARFGIIIDHTDGKRIDVPSIHPIILKNSKKYKFISGISENDYNKILKELDLLEVAPKKDTIKIKESQREKWEENRCVARIVKKRKSTYQIYIPGSVYDLRIGISEEVPVENKEQPVIITRERERRSIKMEELSLDITKVKSKLETTFELELEILTEKYDVQRFKNILFNISKKYFPLN